MRLRSSPKSPSLKIALLGTQAGRGLLQRAEPFYPGCLCGQEAEYPSTVAMLWLQAS
jgi:hypothetical protein